MTEARRNSWFVKLHIFSQFGFSNRILSAGKICTISEKIRAFKWGKCMGKSTSLTPFIYFTIFVVSAGQQFLSDPYLHVKLHSGTKLQIQNWFSWSWSNSSREMWCHVISLHGSTNLIELSAETYEQNLSMPKNSTIVSSDGKFSYKGIISDATIFVIASPITG